MGPHRSVFQVEVANAFTYAKRTGNPLLHSRSESPSHFSTGTPVGGLRTSRLTLRINRPSVEACPRRVLDAAASAPTPSTTPRRREDSGGNAPSAASDFSAHQPLTRSNQDAGATIAFLSDWTPILLTCRTCCRLDATTRRSFRPALPLGRRPQSLGKPQQ